MNNKYDDQVNHRVNQVPTIGGGEMCGEDTVTTASIHAGVRDSVINQARRQFSKADREARSTLSFLQRAESTPGAAEILDLVQTAIDLRVIRINW